MFRANKKLTQSVTFTTEDAADQALWEAIEKELSLTKYQTFSNLCKQALWQFLFVSDSPAKTSTPAETTTSSSSISPTPNHSHKLEEQVSELQKQLSHLEQKMLTEEGNRFERLQRQLTQMTQQLAQLQVAITLQPSSPTPQPASQITSSSSFPEPVAEPVEPETQATPEQESDPVLQRLSSLVDDF
ncbi:flxA-like family protein [Lyngbya aestuarii BL J]|uniref:FlxA-like family protein n=1 Tax=Lyngbya aestuarii BL J TaxID=1348334 RepID=U7QGR4_9CYAN|nr:FlxA-like family protein [Lyngbya aestuarii]ERT07083.1 flxA-like family protein [Lyngbya aestuarii BL J]